MPQTFEVELATSTTTNRYRTTSLDLCTLSLRLRACLLYWSVVRITSMSAAVDVGSHAIGELHRQMKMATGLTLKARHQASGHEAFI